MKWPPTRALEGSIEDWPHVRDSLVARLSRKPEEPARA
jgi:hypothetical protein